ncbi:uncharacterized protein LOC121938183 [Plectropomus leopardus]|uniref:uncharacterized protein LOC121938183 n=1 Tax=Plectropomus leopardus TaxID=160734 RepID=UPI001C4C89A1|nr:uncharacterized protein LOC121938183 [Plectropomus leopardus]
MDESIQKKKKKKKKCSKFKEAMQGRKEKKKKKNRLNLGLDDSFVITQGSRAQAEVIVTPQRSDKLKPDRDLTKKTKRKKKVAFDLSPGYDCAKLPKLTSSAQQTPKESVFLQNEAVRVCESRSQITATGQTHGDESQCTSEDINSQDLFITQKTFRASPSEPSSGETSDKAVSSSPQMFTEAHELSIVWLKQHLDRSYKCPEDLHFYRGKTSEQKPMTAQLLLTEEEKINKARENPKKGKLSFQTQNTKLEKGSHKTPSEVNSYLDEPIVVNSSLHGAGSKMRPPRVSDEPSAPPTMSLTSSSTQTENFFSTELSSYLNFCQKTRLTARLVDLKPLDLSLPERVRKDLGTCLNIALTDEVEHKESNLRPSSHTRDREAKTEPSGGQPWSVRTHRKGETTPSPRSESEPKSTDTTASSEDDPPCRNGKLDLVQVRAVQMRLNESFFFKTKGEGQSPRPESPLMKLTQSRNTRSKKVH